MITKVDKKRGILEDFLHSHNTERKLSRVKQNHFSICTEKYKTEITLLAISFSRLLAFFIYLTSVLV